MDRKELHKFFEGKATPEEKKALKKWLDESNDHSNELLKEREFFDAIILSDNNKEGISIPIKKSYTPHTIVRELLKIASVVIIMTLIGSYLYTRKMGEINSTMHTIFVPAGQRANLQLPDGTNVWLNARSTITYPSYFSGAIREVQLDGEAYFEVEHNKNQPFSVHTKNFDIKVLGTKFNVESYADSEDFSTALMEGAVEITSQNDTDISVLLSPNQKAMTKNGLLTVSQIEDYDIYRWREGLICFKETDFIELMERFEKCYGIRIIVENDKLGNKVFSGKFRISDGIDNALRVLQKEGNYTFERNKDDSIIYIK
ncbi:MAG: FecR family protein [Tannerella sp.]|jgi:ferric-dicitrate binding protein FerR (iron transport regulator)|nr:FecR family protein [Tannerella sp.]